MDTQTHHAPTTEGTIMIKCVSFFLMLALVAAAPSAFSGEEAGEDAGEAGADAGEATDTEPTVEEQMDDAQARGLAAAATNDTEQATGWFTKAAEYAGSIASWEGLMDAALALSSIGETEAAKTVLDKANELSSEFNDWRTSLATGHAYATLPDEAEADDEAETAVTEAKDLAGKLDSWRAMAEVGGAYLALRIDEAKNYATDAYSKALDIAADAKDFEGLETLAMRFDELGDDTKAAEAREIIKQLPPEKRKKKKERPLPPPGWSPTGKTLAEPREISEQSKAILAERAARKHVQALELALKRGNVDEQTYYIYEYDRYWPTHPDLFSHRIWDSGADFDVPAWATQQLGNYQLVNGVYVRIQPD
jgi:hypothetical protein